MARCRRTIAILVAVVLGCVPRVVATQTRSSPAPSARIRVTTAQGRLVGRALSIRDDALTVEQLAGGKPQVIAIPRASILGLELSRGPSRKASGTAIGLLVGIGAALVIGGTWGVGTSAASCAAPPPGSPPHPCDDTPSSGGLPWLGLVALPVGTAILGRAIAPGEKWQATDVDGLSIRIEPSRGGGAALRLVFGF